MKGLSQSGRGGRWTLAQVVDRCTQGELAGGGRAGLEWLRTATDRLVLGGEVVAELSPWSVGVTVTGAALLPLPAEPLSEDDRVRYSAPEILEGAPPSSATNVYSLALLAFELATATPLYGDAGERLRQQVRRGQATAPLYRAREVLPESARSLLRDCLRVDPALRPPLAEMPGLVRECLEDPELQGLRMGVLVRQVMPDAADAMATMDSSADREDGEQTSFRETLPVISPRRQAPRPLVPGATTYEEDDEEPAAPAPVVAPVATVPPVQLRERPRSGTSRPLEVVVGPKGPKVRLRLSDAMSCAGAVAWIEGVLLPLRCGADGALEQSWRLGDTQAPFKGWRLLGTLPGTGGLVLHPVARRSLELGVDLGGERVTIEVSSLLRVGSLLDLLQRRHDPAGRPHELVQDGRVLDPDLLCEEVDPLMSLELRSRA